MSCNVARGARSKPGSAPCSIRSVASLSEGGSDCRMARHVSQNEEISVFIKRQPQLKLCAAGSTLDAVFSTLLQKNHALAPCALAKFPANRTRFTRGQCPAA